MAKSNGAHVHDILEQAEEMPLIYPDSKPSDNSKLLKRFRPEACSKNFMHYVDKPF